MSEKKIEKRYVGVEISSEEDGADGGGIVWLTEGGEAFNENETFTLPELIAKEYPDLREKLDKIADELIAVKIVASDCPKESCFTLRSIKKQLADAILNILNGGE